ncbi:hypothetical protein ACGFJ7_34070 [Actinoplanes sp. NPDC048988]
MAVAAASVPARAEAPAPALEQADVASAMTAAKKAGARVKITDATTETSEYFATPDGKVTGVISAGTVRFRRNGSWVPVDLTLQRQADGSVAPAAHPHHLRISGARASATTDLASLGANADRITVGWPGALPQPRLDGDKATYADVRPGIDLVVQATATGFEQFTVVKSAAAAKYVNEISLPMRGAGVASISADQHGRMQVKGAKGRQQGKLPTPMMWDARSATRGGPPKRRPVTTDVVGTATDAPVTLKLKPDTKWLASPDTVYPVTIDPYYDWSTTVASTTVVKGYPTGWPDADSLFVGSWDATGSARSFVTWWATSLQGMQIDSATAHFANPYSTSCDPKPWEMWSTAPITDKTSWDNQPAWLHKEATSTETTCHDGWVSADATSFFRRAVANNVSTPTMGLRASDETDYSQYKQFWSHNYRDSSKVPYVEVNYSKPAPVTESVVTLPNAVLKAATNDPATATERDAAADAFVAEQAQSGKLVDAAETNASVVNGVATVWEDGVDLTSVKVTTAATTGSNDVVAQGFEVIGTADPSDEDISNKGDEVVIADDRVASGLGLSGLASPKGGTFLKGNCTTTAAKGNKLTSCYEKYKLKTSTSTRDYYYYGRWGTAVGKDCRLCLDPKPTRIDLRSKTWSGSQGAGFGALVAYWPKAGVKNCTDHTIEISILSFGGKIPIQDCDEINPDPGNTSMRVIYDQGATFGGRTHGVDMGFAYSTFKGKNPQLADYSYAKFCTGTYANCDGVARQDSGW